MCHLRDLKIQEASIGDPTALWPCVALGRGDLDVPSILTELLQASRCRAWLVEASIAYGGVPEDDIVGESLAYLRTWLKDVPAFLPTSDRTRWAGGSTE
jgi:hypothetical protein